MREGVHVVNKYKGLMYRHRCSHIRILIHTDTEYLRIISSSEHTQQAQTTKKGSWLVLGIFRYKSGLYFYCLGSITPY